MITTITPTGDRQIALSLCRKWMNHQTVKPDQWIVVDDGESFSKWDFEPYVHYVRRNPCKTDPKHTLVLNIAEACRNIEPNSDFILIMEDDEYYSPKYIEAMVKAMQQHEVVGIGCSKYYHLPTGGYFVHGNMEHASLAQTALYRSFLPDFFACIKNGMQTRWLDDQLWQIAQKKKSIYKSFIFVDKEESLYIGMKGLPGRNGIGIGHNVKTYRDKDDARRSILRGWAPKGYKEYFNLLGIEDHD